MFVVYEIWNPLTDTCFYVGKSSGKRSRFPDHLRQARYLREGRKLTDNNPYKAGTICKIQDAGFEPEYRTVFTTDSEQEALEFEVKLIGKYGRANTGSGILTNLTDGGEGIRGWKLTEEQRAFRVIASTGRRHTEATKAKMREQALGRGHSDETRTKISKMQIGRKASEETKAKMSASQTGRVHSEESKKKMSQSRLNRKKAL